MLGLVLMCGLSFSGKSTLARRLVVALDCDYHSLDDINAERGLWGGQGIPVEEWQRSHDTAEARVRQSLADGRSVVLDDTSNLRFLRDRYRELAAGCGARFALVHVQTPLDEISARMRRADQERDRRPVDESVFTRHLATFEEPGPDEAPIGWRPDDPIEELASELRGRLA